MQLLKVSRVISTSLGELPLKEGRACAGGKETNLKEIALLRPLHVCSSQTCGKKDFFKPRISRQTEYDNEFGSSKLGRTAGDVYAFKYRLCSPQWNGCRKDCGGCRCRLQRT